jgi:signal peptidase I
MSAMLQPLILLLAVLAVPVLLIAAYDKWVLAPKRPRTPEGEVAPGPTYVRVADFLLPFVLLALVVKIGVSEVFGWAKEIAVPLSWLAAPIGLWLALDSWIFAPYRQIGTGAQATRDPPVLRVAYALLPVLVVAVIIRLISAETLDFSLVLLLLSVATGLVWLIDNLVFRKQREKALMKGVGGEMTLPEPGTVDYARSFFPVAFIVLIVRAFIFEPFRIPSDSMMPTLLDGDFIVVNKFAYGLRWPVLNEKFLETGTPQRGEVVVFRYPPDPSVNYIKRLVGLPGDRIEVRDDHLVINGQVIDQVDKGRFTDGCYLNMRSGMETLGEHTHQVWSCRSAYGLSPARDLLSTPGAAASLPFCDRTRIRESGNGGYLCDESRSQGQRDSNDYVFPGVVPPGHYLMIGDNRDNSADSRAWGLVPDQNLVGKATRIWFNFDLQRGSVVNWGRIGDAIQ